jgi:hypothetical protein
MSYVIPAYSHDDEDAALPAATELPALRFVQRYTHQWMFFVIPTAICMLSWAANGIPSLTDVGFSLLTVALAGCLISEFHRFPVRFGIGGLVLYGGSLCWFCQDYFTHWFHADFSDPKIVATQIEPWVIAKAAALHCLFIMMMSIGLNWRKGRVLERLLLALPDPGDNRFFFVLILVLFAIGISPYFLFNAEPSYLAMYHAMFGGFIGEGAKLTAFRSGNLNFSWSAYVAQIMQIGEVGAIFAIMYTILIGRGILDRVVCFLIWTFWFLVGFGTDRRGEVAFFFMPLIALLFIRFQAQAAVAFKRFSLRGYVFCGLLTVVLLYLVQFQGTFRGTGFVNADYSKVDITKNQGNTMFSEGLKAYRLIPDTVPFFRDSVPGQAIIQPIPQTIYDFFVQAIPRALWNNKPIDPLWKWYNEVYLGVADGTRGTTISHGLVGSWYFSYGIAGVIEGGILVGFMMGVSERALQSSEGRPLGVLVSLGFATWLFRTFRDWIFIDLYGLIIGCVGMYVLIILLRPFFGGSARSAARLPEAQVSV